MKKEFPSAGDAVVSVKLTPKASRNAIRGWAQDADGKPVLKVTVTAVPEKGKANAALIELLSEEWKIPQRNITIIRGETDRRKTLCIRDIPPGILPET